MKAKIIIDAARRASSISNNASNAQLILRDWKPKMPKDRLMKDHLAHYLRHCDGLANGIIAILENAEV